MSAPSAHGALPLAAPWLGGAVLLVGVPFVAVILLSLTEYDGIQSPRWLGFENYTAVLSDVAFHRAVAATAVIVGVGTTLRLGLVIALGLLLARQGPIFGAARLAVFAPFVVPDVAYALFWLWALNPVEGPLPLSLLTAPGPARLTVAVVSALQLGEGFILVVAARRQLPGSLYEAAALEQATPWFVTSKVTLPLLAPLLAMIAIRDLVLTLTTSVAPILLLTGGGPNRATTTVAVFSYQEGFRYLRFGSASAVGVLILAFIALLIGGVWSLHRVAVGRKRT